MVLTIFLNLIQKHLDKLIRMKRATRSFIPEEVRQV